MGGTSGCLILAGSGTRQRRFALRPFARLRLDAQSFHLITCSVFRSAQLVLLSPCPSCRNQTLHSHHQNKAMIEATAPTTQAFYTDCSWHRCRHEVLKW